jgi:hypothetical protein
VRCGLSLSDVPVSARSAQWLGAYAEAMEWVLAHKDFNAFWPVGLPSAGTAMGDQLITFVEGLLDARPTEGLRVPNPTAVLILLFFSTYGIRVSKWPRHRRLAYASGLLGIVSNSKSSPVVDRYGRHALQDQPPEVTAWSVGALASVNTFAALSWACAECLFFCNHRVGTERHGPYRSSRGHHVMVRSIFDLAPRALWPEIDRWPVFPQRVDLVVEYPASYSAPFDLFANPLFEFDINAIATRTAVLATASDGAAPFAIVDFDEIDGWNEALRATIGQVAAAVRSMTVSERIQRLHQIMLYACQGIFGAPADLTPHDHRPGPLGHAVDGPQSELRRYYDLRQDTPC